MSDDTVNSQEEVIEDISDEEADKLFENGGVAEEKPEVKEDPATEEEQEIVAEAEKATEEPEKEKKEEPKVNLGALHEERAKRKELEGKVSVMEERFKQIIQSLQPKPEEPSIPAIEDDPVANFDYRLQQAEQQNKEFIQYEQRRQVENQVVSAYKAGAAEFSSKNPDFVDAYNYLIKGRVEELKLMGLEEQQALQAIQQEEFQIAHTSLQQGANPSERLYAIAKQRGWKAQRSDAPAKDLKVIEKGQQKSQPKGGSTPSGELSLEALAEMSDEDFNANWDKLMKA